MIEDGQSNQAAAKLTTVVVIEDMTDVRRGLAALISGTSGFRCIADYSRMETALAEIEKVRPDIILTDLGLPGMSGIEGIVRLRVAVPDTAILALTVYDSDDQIFAALCSGANGYLLKSTPPARLLEALEEAKQGSSPISPSIAARVIKLFREFKPTADASYHLTPQEVDLLRLLIEGHNKKTAAREMSISYHTVSFHLKNIYEKLQVHSQTEAVSKALRNRLV